MRITRLPFVRSISRNYGLCLAGSGAQRPYNWNAMCVEVETSLPSTDVAIDEWGYHDSSRMQVQIRLSCNKQKLAVVEGPTPPITYRKRQFSPVLRPCANLKGQLSRRTPVKGSDTAITSRAHAYASIATGQ